MAPSAIVASTSIGTCHTSTSQLSIQLKAFSPSKSRTDTNLSSGSTSTLMPTTVTADIFPHEVYQHHLTAGCIPVDTRAIEQKFSDELAENLLLPIDPEVNFGLLPEVKVFLFGGAGNGLKPREIPDVAAFDSFLKLHASLDDAKSPLFTFCEIPSLFSWGWLMMNDEVFRRIIQSEPTRRSPYFFALLHLYGQKTQQIHEDYPVFKVDPATKEINYNLTHPYFRPKDDVSRKPGEDDKAFQNRVPHTWVLRKMGILARDRSFVFIQPSQPFSQRLRLSWEAAKSSTNYSPTAVHLMAVEAANQDWMSYVNALEVRLLELGYQTRAWNITQSKRNKSGGLPTTRKVKFETIPVIQSFKEAVLLLLQAVRINLANIQCLMRALDSRFTSEEKEWMEDALRELQNLETRANSIFERAVCIMESVPAMLARQENLQMCNLAKVTASLGKRSAENARSMYVLTILAMAFLPISLMASIISMVVFRNDEGRIKVSGRDLGWFFLATGSLLIMTCGLWWVSNRWSSRKVKAEVEEEKEMV